MFEIGFWEVFLIVVLALVIIGPERLPGAARAAGYWVGRIRRYIEGVRNEVEQEFDVSEFKRLMHNQEIQINELQRKLNEKLNEDAISSSTDNILSKYDLHEEPLDHNEEETDSAHRAIDKAMEEDGKAAHKVLDEDDKDKAADIDKKDKPSA